MFLLSPHHQVQKKKKNSDLVSLYMHVFIGEHALQASIIDRWSKNKIKNKEKKNKKIYGHVVIIESATWWFVSEDERHRRNQLY